MVQFAPLNLLSDFSSLGTFDVVFCRNVLIYFDQDTKIDVLERHRTSDGAATATWCLAPPKPWSGSPTRSGRSPSAAGSISSTPRAPAVRWAD